MSQPEKSAVRILWQSTIRPWRVLFDDHDVADAQLRRRPVDGILKIVCPPADAQDAGPSDGGRHSDSALRSNARDAVTIFGSRQLTDHPRAKCNYLDEGRGQLQSHATNSVCKKAVQSGIGRARLCIHREFNSDYREGCFNCGGRKSFCPISFSTRSRLRLNCTSTSAGPRLTAISWSILPSAPHKTRWEINRKAGGRRLHRSSRI